MSFVIDEWMKQYTAAAQGLFGGRIWFLGLQGSYGRGEATNSSDIDAVLILDSVSAKDLDSYSKMLDALPNRDKVCGFVSGKKSYLHGSRRTCSSFIMTQLPYWDLWMNYGTGSQR